MSWEFPEKFKSKIFLKTSLDSYFKLKSDTFLKSARLENQESKPWGKTLENLIFCMILTNLTKTGGGRVSCFTLYWNFTNKFLEHWNTNYRQLCLYCAIFNLNEITIVKKENISSVLLAKMHQIIFYQQLLERVCSAKRGKSCSNMKRYSKHLLLTCKLSKI